MEEAKISLKQSAQLLERALYEFHSQNEFGGGLLQEMGISLSDSVPTAALRYSVDSNEFSVVVNPEYFAKLTDKNRVAIIEHEFLHFTTKHIIRGMLLGSNEKNAYLHNVAMDISINQYINDLPPGGVYPEQFTTEDGKPFPKYLKYEDYFDFLSKTMPESKGGSRSNEEATKSPHPNEDVLKKYGLLDEHDIQELSEEEKRRMLQEAGRIVKRTIEKTSNSQSKNQKLEEYKEFFEYIENTLRKLNTKAIFKMAVRQSIVRSEREGTWNRPNRRFGYIAPGTRQAKVPFLDVYCDTSGSMSIKELSRFMKALFRLCETAAPSCRLSLWHTALYHNMKFNKNTKFENIPWQSGGTDITDVAKDTNQRDSDLTIIMTDGYYTTDVAFKKKNVVWLISEKGGLSHPCRDVGKTFLLEDLING